MKKLIAMLGAVVAAVTSAFAADLLVSWEGDFKTGSKVGTDGKTYTLALNDNTVAEDGSTLTVSQAKAPTITLPSQMGQHISVIMKYSGYTTPSSRTAFLSLSPSGCNDVGLSATSEKLSGFWNNNGTEYGPQTMTAPASGLAVLSYSCSTDNKGTFGYIGTINADGTISYSGRIGVAGLRFTNASYNMDGKTVNLGGVSNTGSHPSMQNLVIEKVAIFSGLFEANNDATLTGFVWPNYQRWAANPAVLTWADTASGTQAFHEGPWNLFSIKGGTDTTKSYTTTAAQLPGQTANITPWHAFSSTSGYKYVAPGYVLRLAPGYSAGNLNATFTDLTFGGLIVEKGATGYEFNSDGTRQTAFGDNRASNGVDTWYEIHENLRFHRQGPVTLNGALNFDIDAGKTLDLNSARTGQTIALNPASHAALKLHGAGNLKVHNLNASGAVTLDYTDVDLTREDAYVTGTITLGTATTIKLPADLTVGDSVKLATTLAGSIDSMKVLVGGEADENILWTIDGGSLVATQAPDVVTIGATGYVSLGKALEAVEGTATITLAADIIGRNETIPAGVTIELAGHAITGTLDINAGAVITDGGVAKIDGIATNFDITFNHKEDVGKTGASDGTIDYAGVSGMHVRFDNAFELVNLDEAGEVTKNTGAHLKNHPYIEGITGFYRNTDHLSFAVVGTMPNAKNTTFIHMGESRTGNDGGYGLLIATGSKDDEVIVAWNKGTEIHEISRMSVPNAASSRHVYIITKDDDRDADTSTFTVYLDGQKWKTIVQSPRFMIIGGLQVGSDFGGIIKDAYNRASETDKAKYFRQSAAEDGGVINVIRAYDRIITSAEIAQYSVPSEYPYVSPNGSSARTVEGSVNWISETAEWSNTPAGETTAILETAPLAGAIDLTASAAATISVNLEADATCEALTLKESAMSFVKGGEGAIIPTAATIGVPVTLVPTALDLSAAKTMIVGDGKIIADYSGYDVKSIYTEKSVFVTGEIDQQAEGVVTATLPTCEYRTIGALAYNTTTHQYGFTVTPVMVDVEIPSIANTTVSVTAGTLNCTITEGVASVPGGADITVTYAPVAGYHFTAETPVASVTASDVTAETEISVAGVTPVEINMYTVKVMQVANAIATVTIGEGTPAVVTDDTVQVPHGSAFRVDYAAAEGYKLVAIEGDESGLVTENYHYGQVTQNMGDYTLHFEVVPAAPAAPTATVDDTLTVEGLDSAYAFTADTPTTEQAEYYDLWNANFVVTFDKAVAAGSIVLKGSYAAWNDGEWVEMTMPEGGVAADTPWTLLPVDQVQYRDVLSIGTFKCGVANKSNDNTGTKMTVTLVLSDGTTTHEISTTEYTLVEPKATDLPGAEEVPAADKDAYNEWAAANGVTESTTTAPTVLATAFAMGVTVPSGSTIEEAAQQAVEDEVPSIDMAELVAGNLEDAVKAINEKYKGKVEASLVEVTEGTLKSTETAKFYKLSITIKK